ncbi:MAG: hypothetical protein JST69_01675 [Bacteroidetes bacterium]|nr:hypothetical protein [Bacteroidota bacterium]
MAAKIGFVVLVFSSSLVQGQSSPTLMGARAAGVGYASAGLADEWAYFNNIGGIGKQKIASGSFAYEIKPTLTGANRMAASFLTPLKWGTAGVGIFRFGDEVYNEHLFSVGVGNTIGHTSLGLKTNYVQYRAEGFGQHSAISIDLGGITQLTQQFSIGAYITNLTQSKLNSVNAEPLPTKLVAGFSFRPSDQVLIATELEKDLLYRATWRSGVEYALYKKIFFRTGFNLSPNAAFFGLGVLKKNIKIDYAIRFNQLTGTVHQASAVYQVPIKPAP